MTAPLITVHVPGEPVSKQRPRLAAAGHVYTPRETKVAEETIGWLTKAQWRREADPTAEFAIHMTFYYGNKRRSDLDNKVKLILDATNHVVWKDDSQIAAINAIRLLDRANPRTIIRIYRFEEIDHEFCE